MGGRYKKNFSHTMGSSYCSHVSFLCLVGFFGLCQKFVTLYAHMIEAAALPGSD